jgi:thiamine biosynthesis protein ThiI
MKCVVRYSEIGLKSAQSRRSMERTLIHNIQACVGHVRIKHGLGRIIVDTDDARSLARVFGVASVSPALEVKADLESIEDAALKLYTKGSFRVSCRRITKDTKETSMEMMRKIGAYIQKETGAGVSLKKYDVDIGIEILRGKAYLFNTRLKGPAGLPLGTQGKAVMRFDGSERAVAAAYLVMKRGVEIIPIGKVSELSNLVHEQWVYGSSFEPVHGKMVEVARDHGCLGVVVSRDISLDELRRMKQRTQMLILTPLLGYGKGKIKRIAKLVTKK